MHSKVVASLGLSGWSGAKRRTTTFHALKRETLSRVLGVLTLLCLLVTIAAAPVMAQGAGQAGEANLRALINELGAGNFAQTEKGVNDLAASGDPVAAPALKALSSGDLYLRKSDRQVFIGKSASGGYELIDPITQQSVGTAGRRDVTKIRLNNNLRRAIRSAMGSLTLLAHDPATRLKAANAVFASHDADSIEALDQAIAAETVPEIKSAMEEARAAAVLHSNLDEAEKLNAVRVLSALGGREALSQFLGAQGEATGQLRTAIDQSISSIQKSLAIWDGFQNVWYGLSLGSVLLLAAIGLAITFGVMGVINMAHGEMVMIGAYVTFVVQEIIRQHAPGLFDYSLFFALPLAFLVAGAVGVVIERCIIRFLYGRPLETLLATWGLSLILQQAVRSIFGPTNREVGNPSWMSGAFDLGQMTITYNRMWIVVFSLVLFAGLILVLKKTPFGLYMRAVTQNRPMAASMGIRTPWVDALTFGLGSGIAGLAGVALSQIDNVSPNLGQSYIIDSFMVVVFGGVGNLWGTLVGAATLGVVNKFLEPYAGAVLGKILILVFIIIFIQKRPRGLFALKGRAVDA